MNLDENNFNIQEVQNSIELGGVDELNNCLQKLDFLEIHN